MNKILEYDHRARHDDELMTSTAYINTMREKKVGNDVIVYYSQLCCRITALIHIKSIHKSRTVSMEGCIEISYYQRILTNNKKKTMRCKQEKKHSHASSRVLIQYVR